MGLSFSNIFQPFYGKKEMTILMWGLDAAGKTAILYRLKMGEMLSTIPTIAIDIQTVEYKNINFVVCDAATQINHLRRMWLGNNRNIQGIMFVVDSSDRERIEEAREDLMALLEHDELSNSIILVYANKQDLPNAMTVTEVSDKLGLTNLTRKWTWYAQAASSKTGDGLFEGLDYFADELKRRS